MAITRAQVDDVKALLGLHKDLTYSVSITPLHVYVQQIETVDGEPVIRDGVPVMHDIQYSIEEEVPGDGNDS